MDKDNSGVFENCNNHIREKLVELLESINAYAEENLGFDKVCGGELIDFRGAEYIADHLIANNVTVQEWISVGEPPKEWRRDNGEMINYLVYVPEYGVDIGNYGEPAKCWLCMGLPCKPTHWAPMPQPPKGVSGDG